MNDENLSPNESLIDRLKSMDLSVSQRARLHRDLNTYYKENKVKRLTIPCATAIRRGAGAEAWHWSMEVASDPVRVTEHVRLTTGGTGGRGVRQVFEISVTNIPEIVQWLSDRYKDMTGFNIKEIGR